MMQRNLKMNKNKPTCPACGSTVTRRHENIKSDHITLGSEFSYKEIYFSCDACHEEIDIFGETDQSFLTEQKKAQHKFIQHSIEWLSQNKIKMALFERIFELPARTLTRWKEGNFSSSTLSLLHIIITYPWIIKVAEKRFNSDDANRELIYAATKKFLQCTANSLSAEALEVETKSSNIIFVNVPYQNKSVQPKIMVNGKRGIK